MTKALYCGLCGTVRTFQRNGDLTTCDCGAIAGWWVDPYKGIARLYPVHGTHQRPYGRIIGMHSGFLLDAVEEQGRGETHRTLHEYHTNAPGYLFDKGNRNCWAIVIAPGESNDTRWASEIEYADKIGRPVGDAYRKTEATRDN